MNTVVKIEAVIEHLPPEAQLELRKGLLQRPGPDQHEDMLVPRSCQQKVMDVLDQRQSANGP